MALGSLQTDKQEKHKGSLQPGPAAAFPNVTGGAHWDSLGSVLVPFPQPAGGAGLRPKPGRDPEPEAPFPIRNLEGAWGVPCLDVTCAGL